jgi:aminoglycoside phosphotransferase (APT) family kinase protein
VTADVAAAILRSQFSALADAQVTFLGEGCDSVAFDVDGRWVFRFPKRADVAEGLIVEGRLLEVLRDRSPLPLPAFTFHGAASDGFPYVFCGYPRLPGVPGLQFDVSAMPAAAWTAMGRFLSWLHRVPIEDAARAGVPARDAEALLDEVRTDALDGFHLVARVAPGAPLERWHAFLADHPPAAARVAATSALVHHDLSAEHVLCDPATRRVTGVIDWADAAIADVSVDLAAFLHWGGQACLDAVLTAYDGPVDGVVLLRARYLAACRGAADVAFGLEYDRPEYVRAGILALAQCVR